MTLTAEIGVVFLTRDQRNQNNLQAYEVLYTFKNNISD